MAQTDSQQAVQPMIDWAKGVVHPSVKFTDFLNEFPRNGEEELNNAVDAIKQRFSVGKAKAESLASDAAARIRSAAAKYMGSK